MVFQFISLLLFYIALEKGTITLGQVCMQLMLFATYVIVVYFMDKS